MTMQLITEYIDQVGFPPGVFNLVNGDKTISEAFMASPKVKGISTVGSTNTCKIIAENCAKTNKRFQAMGSAKNHLVVMPDAKVRPGDKKCDYFLLWLCWTEMYGFFCHYRSRRRV